VLKAAVLAVLLCLACGPGVAQERIPVPASGKTLVAYIPPGTTIAEVMQAARQALIVRRWAIQAASDDAIRARLVRHGSDARLTIFYANGVLQYAEEGEAPPHWIDNLRTDIPRLLLRQRAANDRTERAETSRARAGNTPEVNAERLRALKQLFDSGMITREEYDRKRAEMLKDL
jgi:hypothetical protein